MPSEHESTNPPPINTNGGAVVEGNVSTAGGDFVGRDKIIVTEEAAYQVYGLTNPYLGLRAFHYEDRAIYAGREQLAQETVRRLTQPGTQQTRLFITGASGSGKSSFAQAGLIPQLESHYAAYQKTVRHVIFRPSSQPMVMLTDALQRLHPDLTPETLATNTPKTQINLLLIDQFEELFIQSDASQRAPFCDFLTNLPSFAECRTHILITLRVDYLDELFAIQPLWAIAKEGIELRIMSAADLRNAIQKPLQVNHPQKRFAPELLDRLVQDGGADAALLPLLQVTLAELWKTGKLILSNYHSLTDAIRQRAEIVYAFSDHASADPKTPRLAPDQQELMGILLDLINVSVDSTDRRDARQRRTRQELENDSTQRSRLIEELVNARLLSAANETHNEKDVEVIDIIHESLIDNWDRLRQTIEEQRQQLQRRARFKLWLGEWVRNGRQDGYLLLTDIQLAEARVLVEGRDIEVQNAEAQEFYLCSLEYQASIQRAKDKAEAEHKARQQWLRRVGVALVIMIIAAGIALWQWQRAEIAYKESERLKDQIRADQIAQKAALANIDTSLEHYPQRALLLAIEAVQIITPSLPASLTALHDLLGRTGGKRFAGYDSTVTSVAFSPNGKMLANGSENGGIHLWSLVEPNVGPVVLVNHEGSVNSVAFSPDGKILASGGNDGTIQIWSLAEPNATPMVLHGHDKPVMSIAFSPDGKILASGGNDGTIRLWSLADLNTAFEVLGDHAYSIKSVAFSPDGKTLASGSETGTIRLWSLSDLRADPVMLDSPNVPLSSVTFSPDGKTLASGSYDGRIHLWSLAEPDAKPIVLSRHEGYVLSLAFSPDGKRLASGGSDKTIRLWSLSAPNTVPDVLHGHDSAVNSLTFSPDGKTLASGSTDNTIRFWSLTLLKTDPIVLHGHDFFVNSVTFSPDGKTLASGSEDNTIRLWSLNEPNATSFVFPGHNSSVTSVAFSHDGKTLASGSDDKTIRLWSLVDPNATPIVLSNDEASVRSMTFSPDGKTLASGSSDETIRLWSLAEPKAAPVKLSNQASSILSLAFSPDGKMLASGSETDTIIRLWSMSDLSINPFMLNHGGSVSSLAFSPDGKTLASGGYDSTIHLWSLFDLSDAPVVLSGHEGYVGSVAFSPDGKTLASGGYDNTIRLWSLTEPNADPVVLRGHDSWVSSVAFSPDGKTLASGSYDNTIRLWQMDNTNLIKLACAAAGRNLRQEEWHHYFLGKAYHTACPQWSDGQ